MFWWFWFMELWWSRILAEELRFVQWCPWCLCDPDTYSYLRLSRRSRSSQPRCSIKKAYLKILLNSQESTCFRVSFLIKNRLWHKCFLMSFANILRTSFYRILPGECFCWQVIPKDKCLFKVLKQKAKKKKQPLRVVPIKRCSENVQQIYRRTPMLKCDFLLYICCTFWEYLFLEHLWVAASENKTIICWILF